MYLGFDRSGYPGDAIMQSLKASTNMTFVAVYLAPAPSHGDPAWMAHVPDLKAAGWGLLPVYVGQQTAGGPGSHSLTAARGTNGTINLLWPSSVGHGYQVLGSTNGTTWTPVSGWILATSASTSYSLPPPTAGSPYLFRLEVQP